MTGDDAHGVLAILSARSASKADGIRDYTEQLATHLRASGAPLCLFARDPGPWTMRVTALPGQRAEIADRGLACADEVLLQYNPFSHGRRGFAPGLALMMLALRGRRSRPTIALMVHETYVDPDSWRWRLMRGWQRLQLVALHASADVVFCSIQRWSERLERSWPRAPVHHAPVPSNLPDCRAQRAAGRQALGVADDTLVLATFGLDHVGRIAEYVLDAAEAAARQRRRVLLVNLGTCTPAGQHLRPGVELRAPGFLPADDAARLVAGSDVFLAPFRDGVSTRRTTVMAALQHEVAVVGTDGHLTDDVLRAAGQALRLVPVDDHDGFVAAVCALAADDAGRRQLGRAGRKLYEERFDWPVLVEQQLAAMREVRR